MVRTSSRARWLSMIHFDKMMIHRLPDLLPPIFQLYLRMNKYPKERREDSGWIGYLDHRLGWKFGMMTRGSQAGSGRRSEIFIFLTSSSYFLVQEICSSRLARQPDGIHTALRTRAHSKTLLPKCIGMHHVPCRFSWRAEVIQGYKLNVCLPLTYLLWL